MHHEVLPQIWRRHQNFTSYMRSASLDFWGHNPHWAGVAYHKRSWLSTALFSKSDGIIWADRDNVQSIHYGKWMISAHPFAWFRLGQFYYYDSTQKSKDSIGTMCNQFSLENRALLHKILPYPSMANFTTRILLRSQNFQNTTLPISAQCVMLHYKLC